MDALDLDAILRYAHETNRDFFFFSPTLSIIDREREGEMGRGLPSGLGNQTSTQVKG